MRITGIAATFALAAALFVAAPGCKNDGHDDHNHPTTQPSTGSGSATASADVTSAGQPVNKNCAVEQEHSADPKIVTLHDGKTYAFCCEDCIDTFKKDPAKYANAK